MGAGDGARLARGTVLGRKEGQESRTLTVLFLFATVLILKAALSQ